jgi:hypothetical protein
MPPMIRDYSSHQPDMQQAHTVLVGCCPTARHTRFATGMICGVVGPLEALSQRPNAPAVAPGKRAMGEPPS